MSIVQKNRFEHLTDKEQQVALEFVARVHQRFNGQLVSAVLFGSRARGEAEPGSDMDVLIVLSNANPETQKEIRYLAAEVWLEYGIYLSTRVWSLGHWRRLEGLQTLLYQNIRRDGIDLLGFVPATC